MNPLTAATDAPDLTDEDVDSNDMEEMEETGFTITRRTPTTVTMEDNEEEEGEEDEVPDVGPSTTKKNTKRKARISTKKDIPDLPEAPFFDNVFLHGRPAHGGHPNLPPALRLDQVFPPLQVFSLFFTDAVLTDIATNTNAYAALKGAGVNEGSRKWKDTTLGELRIFIGIVIYIGVFVPRGPVQDLWTTSPRLPKHDIHHFMTVHRFQQLKRFLHISSPHTTEEHWYSKLEPLSSKLSADFSRFYVPSTDVSVDEMIDRFSGRSTHTVKMKNKPTPEGFKIYALCESGYTFSFLYYSRMKSVIGVIPIEGLNPTSSAVVHLARTLPSTRYPFNIYMDNFFSNIPLFKHLRDLKIGAYGTARVSSKHFPPALKVDKKSKFEWDTLSGAVVDNTVLAVVWVDNAPVPMLSTIHQITGEESRIARLRFRPRTTSTNAARAPEVFNGQHCAVFKIPKIIDDYNHNMNGVDVSDQYRSHYNTQLTVFRTWMPLFFWILDTTIVNAYRIYKAQGGTLSHRDFRIELAWTLASEGNMNDTQTPKATRQHHQKQDDHEASKSIVYVTQSMPDLPDIRHINKGLHYPHSDQTDKSRPNCILCRYKATKLKDENFKVKTPTPWSCNYCKVPLCLFAHRNCFNEYHGFP